MARQKTIKTLVLEKLAHERQPVKAEDLIAYVQANQEKPSSDEVIRVELTKMKMRGLVANDEHSFYELPADSPANEAAPTTAAKGGDRVRAARRPAYRPHEQATKREGATEKPPLTLQIDIDGAPWLKVNLRDSTVEQIGPGRIDMRGDASFSS